MNLAKSALYSTYAYPLLVKNAFIKSKFVPECLEKGKQSKNFTFSVTGKYLNTYYGSEFM
jgi:hypothetical protein